MNPWFLSLFFIIFVNISVYVWAYKRQSDALTDFTYSFCFFVATAWLLLNYGTLTPGRILLAFMIFVWSWRLGGFLFFRIRKMNRDTRFDSFRQDPKGFLKFWLLQSVSIWILTWPIITGLTSDQSPEVYQPALLLFLIGFILESVADWQKFRHKSEYGTTSFIQTGLYSTIRHPNYLGEILVWISVFWYVTPVMQGWMWISVLSPVWITLLLLFISGIPLIEKANAEKYKGNTNYQVYLKKTKRLIPFLY